MNNFLRYIDMFSYHFKMTIKEREKISSIFGILFSIITFFIFLTLTWFTGNDFIYKSNPITYMDQNIRNSYPRVPLSREFAPLAFGVQNEFAKPFNNESIVNFKLIKHSLIFNQTSKAFNDPTITQLEMEKCNLNNFPTISKEEFDNAGLIGAYCPKNYADLYVESSWVSSTLTYLMFDVYKCDYEKYPDKCASEQEIDKTIGENLLNYNLFFIESNIALGNYNNPISQRIMNKYKFLHPKNYKLANYFINKNKIITDVAFFSSQFEEIEYSKVEVMDTDIINIDNRNITG